MRLFTLILAFFSCTILNSQSLTTVYESTNGRETPTYSQAIDWWKKADAAAPMVKMLEIGKTDAGFPLHLVLVSAEQDFSIKSLKAKKRNIILINNGIHPGEPDGIDASMLLVKDIIKKKYTLPKQVVLAIIPIYNIGGALNRSTTYRVDQNGPDAFGFRGNAQNLDLNRDFIKADSKNAISFAKIFHLLDPDVFVDNHVSNGADYQHVMTLLTTQHNKLGGKLGQFINQEFEPALYASMKTKGFDLVPYVNHFGETPDKGWPEFWDSPRYSSGYAALFQSFAFVPETHMLKPYPQRVTATKALMQSFIEFTVRNGSRIISLRAEARKQLLQATEFPIAWKWDSTKATTVDFEGFEAGRKLSQISGLPRLYYDHTKPFEKKIPFYNQYIDTLSITAPQAYIIPQGWWKVIERLQANNIQLKRLQSDTMMEVEVYRITNYQASARPFEGHHPNGNVQVQKKISTITFRKGDYIVSTKQPGKRFLIETLEPQAEDSYFFWNFFDAILGQKEGFSDYVFEETAARYLEQHPELKIKLEERKKTDAAFANSARAQLSFIYQNSPYYEPAHMQYPVYRLMK